jgi:thiol-disulfide isomerase/thioredoxin
MRPIKNAWTALLGLLLAMAFSQAARADDLKEGQVFPDLATFKLEGKLPDDLKGKVVLVDFWASWCEPCKLSFPVMEDLHKAWHEKGLVVIAVNVDERARDMQSFLKKHPVPFTVVRDGAQKLVAHAAISTMPTSFMIDRAGKVRFVHHGFLGDKTRKEYEKEVETLAKEQAP